MEIIDAVASLILVAMFIVSLGVMFFVTIPEIDRKLRNIQSTQGRIIAMLKAQETKQQSGDE